MIIKFQGYPNHHRDIKLLRWLFKDYFRVTDEKLFLLEVVKYEFTFEKIDDTEYEWMLYTGIPSRT